MRERPTDPTLLQTALSMLSTIAHGNQTGNKAPAPREGAAARWPRGCNTGPSGALCGRDLRDPSQSIVIDRGGNYISLAFSPNPRGSAGDTEAETKNGKRRGDGNTINPNLWLAVTRWRQISKQCQKATAKG